MCDYCREDRDGYVSYLPRVGTGNARIYKSPFKGWVVRVSGPHYTYFEIPIDFCPKCGRKLKKGTYLVGSDCHEECSYHHYTI